jgi:UDP-glucose 4-epimerase
MRVLVTGGAGYVGSVCSEQLINAGHEVTVLDDFRTGHRAAVHPSAQLVEGDFGDMAVVRGLLRKVELDAVMHFAGETLVEKSMSDPRSYFHANVRSGIDFLDALLDHGIKMFVFSSTAAVYGEPVVTPITETHPTNPINAYGESKLIFEHILDWYRRAYGFRYFALRYFNAAGASVVYGEAHNPESHLLPRILDSVLRPASEFVIHGEDYDTPDGTCIRDYVHVADIAHAHILALAALREGKHWGAYNIGTNKGHSVREVLRAVEEVTGHKLRFRIGPRREGDPAILVASHERLAETLGWRPRFSDLREIVRSAWVWRQQHPRGYESAETQLIADGATQLEDTRSVI